MPRPVGEDECSDIKTDRQDILVLYRIFAEAGKPRLSVKPRPLGGELHLKRFGFINTAGDGPKRGGANCRFIRRVTVRQNVKV